MTPIQPVEITVGLPVYNGEKYLASSIDSIISQTFQNFELVITDNASTDNTGSICKKYAQIDSRVKYHRNEKNLGASANHNLTVSLAKGKYFVWGSYDDIRHPEYLEKCHAYLTNNPSSSACHSLTRYIDGEGKETSREEVILDISSEDPVKRFSEMIRMDHKVEMILALMRTEILHKTPGLAAYSDSDRVLMAEMCLNGPIGMITEYLFYRREHEDNSSKVYTSRQSRMAWFDPKFAGKISFPHYRQFYEYLGSISRSPLSGRDKLRCLKVILKWLIVNRARLLSDIQISTKAMIIKSLLLVGLRKK